MSYIVSFEIIEFDCHIGTQIHCYNFSLNEQFAYDIGEHEFRVMLNDGRVLTRQDLLNNIESLEFCGITKHGKYISILNPELYDIFSSLELIQAPNGVGTFTVCGGFWLYINMRSVTIVKLLLSGNFQLCNNELHVFTNNIVFRYRITNPCFNTILAKYLYLYGGRK